MDPFLFPTIQLSTSPPRQNYPGTSVPLNLSLLLRALLLLFSVGYRHKATGESLSGLDKGRRNGAGKNLTTRYDNRTSVTVVDETFAKSRVSPIRHRIRYEHLAH